MIINGKKMENPLMSYFRKSCPNEILDSKSMNFITLNNMFKYIYFLNKSNKIDDKKCKELMMFSFSIFIDNEITSKIDKLILDNFYSLMERYN